MKKDVYMLVYKSVIMKILKKVIFSILVFVIFFEIISLISSKFNLLLFNSDPIYFKKSYDGESWRISKEYGMWHKKNSSSRHRTKCFDVNYSSNNIGARDNIDYFNDTFKNSIILLGDSFAEGYGVELENTFAKIIEKKINKKVINLASSASSPIDHYKKLNHFVKVDTNEIIYFFLPQNDFKSEKKKEKKNKINTEKKSIYKIIIKFLSKFTYSFNSLATIKFFFFNYDVEYSNASYSYNNIDNIKYTYSIIEKTLNKEKIDKTLIVIPTRKDFQFHGYNKKYKNLFWYEELLKLTTKHNITLIDLYDHFEIKNQYKYYHECDGHWNSYGHLNAAKIYLEHKEQKK